MAITNTNLKWFYSGGASNSDPSLSFGGTKSSETLALTLLNNLFDNVSGDEAVAGRTEYRLLYFQNDDADSDGLMTPVKLWIVNQPTGQDSMEIGLAYGSGSPKNAVEPAPANDTSAPPNVSFSAPSSKGTGISLPSPPYTTGQFIGVWFKRIVPSGASVAVSDGFQWRIEGDTV